ncbi:MAG: tyrosine-type recombinase/integrase [Clostridiales bacterium]|nr:tyrosine-type recombinase/integrase [Candidatus Cacconaster stercorequi]
MEERFINSEIIGRFQKYLTEEEKSDATIEKYIRDVTAFASYMDGAEITKEIVIAYKQHLLDDGYAVRSINSMLASINSLFCYLGWTDLKVKSLKVQQQVFCPEEKELTRAEYERLCRTAQKKHNERLCLILQTICSTGIRVSELPFITVEAVRNGKAVVSLKGKTRVVLLLKDLQKKLLRYISKQKISDGCVFVTRTGKPVSRSNIWREMKGLCEEANVDPRKVFPHNLRHLFARIFYGLEKDIVRLADVLGHSSVNTTRIYIISTGAEHRQCMEQMRLVI